MMQLVPACLSSITSGRSQAVHATASDSCAASNMMTASFDGTSGSCLDKIRYDRIIDHYLWHEVSLPVLVYANIMRDASTIEPEISYELRKAECHMQRLPILTAVVTDCLRVSISLQSLVSTRCVYSGNVNCCLWRTASLPVLVDEHIINDAACAGVP